ncbi:MAG: EVE domain-containing protein [Alphaproteobacteria bacterium]|nr:EVE domain-containing protein [Alphaproteobacteria bacterium]
MKYWLLKSEPSVYGWAQLLQDGCTHWNGVRNHQAAANLKAMVKGDRAFFYHSNEGKEIVGMVEITRTAYPDPSDESRKFVMVDIRPLRPLARPLPLAEIKKHPILKNMALVRQSRLSVCPVTEKEWNVVMEMD